MDCLIEVPLPDIPPSNAACCPETNALLTEIRDRLTTPAAPIGAATEAKQDAQITEAQTANAHLGNILNELKDDRDYERDIWTDDSGNYFYQVASVNQDTGAIVYSTVTPSGAPYVVGANPRPATIATGMATAANQVAGNALLTHIDNDLHAINALLTAIEANTATPAVPVGAATEVKQDAQIAEAQTANTSLASILAAVDTLEALLARQPHEGEQALPVEDASIGDKADAPATIAGIAGAQSVIALLKLLAQQLNAPTLPTGAATSALQTTGNTTLTSILSALATKVHTSWVETDNTLGVSDPTLGDKADAPATFAGVAGSNSAIALLKLIAQLINAQNPPASSSGVHTGATEAGNAQYVSDASIGDTPDAVVAIGGTAAAPTVGNATMIALLKRLVLSNAPFPTISNGPVRLTAGASQVIPANATGFTVSIVSASAGNTVAWTNVSGGTAGSAQDSGLSFSFNIDAPISANLAGATVTANGSAVAYVSWTTR